MAAASCEHQHGVVRLCVASARHSTLPTHRPRRWRWPAPNLGRERRAICRITSRTHCSSRARGCFMLGFTDSNARPLAARARAHPRQLEDAGVCAAAAVSFYATLPGATDRLFDTKLGVVSMGVYRCALLTRREGDGHHGASAALASSLACGRACKTKPVRVVCSGPSRLLAPRKDDGLTNLGWVYMGSIPLSFRVHSIQGLQSPPSDIWRSTTVVHYVHAYICSLADPSPRTNRSRPPQVLLVVLKIQAKCPLSDHSRCWNTVSQDQLIARQAWPPRISPRPRCLL